MKVCQINNTYYKGSTGKILTQIHEYLLDNNIKSMVCYAFDKKTNKVFHFKYGMIWEKYLSALLTRITGNRYGYAFFQTNKLLSILNKENPDIVHIHCANCYDCNMYRLLSWCGKHGKKVIITEHASYNFTANCSHPLDCNKWKTGCGNCPMKYYATKSRLFDTSHINWQRMKKSFDKIKDLQIITPSTWMYNRTKQSFLSKKNIKIINNGIDVNVFHPCNTHYFDYLFNSKKKTILAVAADLTEMKGLNDYIKLSSELPNDWQIILVGVLPNTDLSSYKNIVGMRRTNSQEELVELYSRSDVFVNFTYADTFPTVNIEALCCGCPIITYDTGGSVEAINENNGLIIEQKNYIRVIKELEYILKLNRNSISQEAINKYNNVNMCKQYLNTYLDIFKNIEGNNE